jgi:hypothetical protein
MILATQGSNSATVAAGPVFTPVEGHLRTMVKRWGYGIWLLAIVAFAAAHLLHLRADFPNYAPWYSDWAKYTDEGWYGNAAIRAHLFGHWYLPGDFNPAPAVPVWPSWSGCCSGLPA